MELAASLNARVDGDTAVFALHVSNRTDRPVRIEFPSSQRYDFDVGTLDGEVLWTWSAGRVFSQATGVVELSPGESLEYGARWGSAKRGTYYVRARVTSSNKPVELRTQFEVPTR